MLKVIGAGLPRTGTTSLKAALEQLLGGDCYHMFEFFERVDEHGLLWWQALEGDLDALDVILDGWAAAIDWPASLFWRELSERHPDAVVVLSHRESVEAWWASVDRTVWASMRAVRDDALVSAWNAKLRAAFGLGPHSRRSCSRSRASCRVRSRPLGNPSSRFRFTQTSSWPALSASPSTRAR